MSVALRGNVQAFGIADVFQLIGQQRKTGVLEFTDGPERVQVCFDSGRVVSAAPAGTGPGAALGDMFIRCGLLTREKVEQLQRECVSSAQALGRVALRNGALAEKELREIEDLLTRETIFAVLRWSSGDFDFRAQGVEHDRDPESLLGAEQILMDGLRMVDEWQSFEEHVPSEDTVFRRVAGFEAYLKQRAGESARQLDAAERIFFLIDGRLTVRRIVDLSLLGSFNAMRILAGLRQASIIEPLSAAELRALRHARKPSVLQRSHLREVIAGLVPLALLAIAATLAWGAPGAPPASTAFALRPEPLQRAREAYASRRVRHALETFRLASGRWPETPGELETQRILASEALAPFAARAYYYVNRPDGPLLLAPER